ncbi:hypothetical protein DFJ58DRAFT_243866 [Suillus subalutaceus]|uniref:uncharacterized protein n=1 Tax=Suillus subalutaceus TaxID=48586 RepID=UPI001B869C8E|nr:uncharacterized protein DFJ58DRAFT_243866 [Suillus subalutaceus]KAG1831905.1 hypothetical protein DFJ58DRAFT_243866 [Suillus subalutaceus]
MSSAVWRASESSTVSSHIPVQSSADHGYHHRLDATIVEETGADRSSLVNSTTGMKTAPMSPDAVSSSEAGRASFTESSHDLDQSATDHSYHRVEDASHCTDACNTSVIGETRVGKSSLVNSTANTQTAPMSLDTMSSSPLDAGRISSTESLHASVHSAASHRSDQVEDASHRADTCRATTVEDTGACQRSWDDLTTGTQREPSSRSAMPPPPGRALSTSNISNQSVAFPTFNPVGEALCYTDKSKAVGPVIVRDTGAGKNYWPNWPNWLITVHTPGRGAAYPHYRRIEGSFTSHGHMQCCHSWRHRCW